MYVTAGDYSAKALCTLAEDAKKREEAQAKLKQDNEARIKAARALFKPGALVVPGNGRLPDIDRRRVVRVYEYNYDSAKLPEGCFNYIVESNPNDVYTGKMADFTVIDPKQQSGC